MHEPALPPRLAQIIPMLAHGLTNAEIADRLVVTLHTAEKYVSELKARFGVRDRVELVMRCQMEVGEPTPQASTTSGNGFEKLEDDVARKRGPRWRLQGLAVSAAVLGVFSGFVVAAAVLIDRNAASYDVPTGEAERLGGDREQQAALEDGKVTPGEYSAAYQRMLDCFDAANIPYVVSTDLHGSPQYSAGPFESKAAVDGAKEVTEACYAEHFRGAEVALAAAQR